MRPDSLFFPHSLNVLQKSPLFKNIGEEQLTEMLASFHYETWTKNSPAMNSKDTLRRFYVILSGRMKVSRINSDTGRELTIFLLSPGDVFDVICLLDEREHNVEVTAIDDLETLYAPLDEVRDWIGKHPEFNQTFLPYLGKQIRALEELASDLSLHDTLTRLSRLILRHMDLSTPRRKLTLINDFSHEELANMTGSVRTVISRHMMKLKKDGIIKSRRKHLEIKNLHSLLEHAEKHIGL